MVGVLVVVATAAIFVFSSITWLLPFWIQWEAFAAVLRVGFLPMSWAAVKGATPLEHARSLN